MKRIQPISPVLRAVDYVLTPAMFVVAGCRLDSIQETHFWHCQKVDQSTLDVAHVVRIIGDDSSRFSNRLFPFPLFHSPIFGGWRNYVVFEVESMVPWHIGWVHYKVPEKARRLSYIQRLPIYD